MFAVLGCHHDEPAPQCAAPSFPDAGTPPIHGATYSYVVNSLSLPGAGNNDPKMFGIDLVGKGGGAAFNKFGSFVSALSSQSWPIGMSVDSAIASGAEVHSISLHTTDSALQNDPEATATWGEGATVSGSLEQGRFRSKFPTANPSPARCELRLTLLPGMPADLVIDGCTIEFTVGNDPASGMPALLDGALQGSIDISEIERSFIPWFAQALTDRYSQPGFCVPFAPGPCMTGRVFDVGACGTCADGVTFCTEDSDCAAGPCMITAMALDGQIDPCEVATNAIFGNVLSPDVQMFACDGTWHPTACSPCQKDSVSIGIGFTAVAAHP
jgi:hypothetical protein